MTKRGWGWGSRGAEGGRGGREVGDGGGMRREGGERTRRREVEKGGKTIERMRGVGGRDRWGWGRV